MELETQTLPRGLASRSIPPFLTGNSSGYCLQGGSRPISELKGLCKPMVESITAESLRDRLSQLQDKNLLTAQLGRELVDLVDQIDRFSNWLDARKYLTDSGAGNLSGAGPISKFLRTLAYTLEQCLENHGILEEKQAKIDQIHLSDTSSGCSDYRGFIQVVGQDGRGEELLLHEGRFVWDCAEHGIPQPEAAQKLGYRCMIQFPDFSPRLCPPE